MLYHSGSQPGVRNKSQGVREIQVLPTFEQYLLLKTSQGVRKFLFLCLGVREHKRLGTAALTGLTQILLCLVYVKCIETLQNKFLTNFAF